MEYLDVLKRLYVERPHSKVKLGLYRIKELLERLGNPHKDYPVIHITGTNGKGSASRIVQAILTESGKRVGLYTSPHLYTFKERISVDGEMITEKEVVDLFAEINPHAKKMDDKGEEFSPSFFEFVTAMAFLYFKEKKVDVAVVEVGLGGRYDATNVVNPSITAITTVDLDHTMTLGNTLRQIAYEKAGIIKENVPVVVGEEKKDPLEVIQKIAEERNASVLLFNRDFRYSEKTLRLNENRFDYFGRNVLNDLVLSLNGKHQLRNASISLRIIEEVEGELKEVSVRKGLMNVKNPGRFEVFKRSGKTIVLDGAHNPAGAKALVESLRIYFPEEKMVGVIGILDDKDRESMMNYFKDVLGKVIITKPKSERAKNMEELFEIAKKYIQRTFFIEEPLKALERAFEEEEEVIVVAGSLYLIGEIEEYLVEGKLGEEWNVWLGR